MQHRQISLPSNLLTSLLDTSPVLCDLHSLIEMSGTMPEAQAEQRVTPYASLRPATDADATKARGDAPANAPPAPDYLGEEADRLECFKQALFDAFLAAPKNGVPTALVDLAATYTSALRLQVDAEGP
jgi:hypothetical protein